MLGNRPIGFIARNAIRRENWQMLPRLARVYVHPVENAWRYFSGRGEYPYAPEVRTPLGVVRPLLRTSHDLLTVNEIFCRGDYEAGGDLGAVVDIGSNIGVSAIYFLTRNRTSRCYLYEPVPANVEQLRANLAGFEDRWSLTTAAVWDRAGTVEFGVESTGRYGGIGVATAEQIAVDCLAINDVLEQVLERESVIDVLKIDTEGAELDTVASINPDLLARIKTIYFETTDRPIVHADRFERSFSCDTCRLVNRSL